METLAFPELAGKGGLYIIEVIGNGVRARAVIKKGSLSLIHKPGVGGPEAYILDEDKKVCCQPGTGVFVNEFIPASAEKGGRIFIPYSQYPEKVNVILLH